MPYKLRLVQKFKQSNFKEFMELEKKFIQLEKTIDEFPKGVRFIPYSGREPGNTLIWECDFPTLQDINDAMDFLENDSRHEKLFKQQVEYFLESHVEIYKMLEE